MAQLKDLLVTGATRILGKVYSPEFVGKLTGNADTATKATGDGLNQNIANNYIKNLTINGRTITFIKGNGTTGTLTTQDTNTWRGIVNNLTSDSTTDSLAAAQGKALKGLVDGKVAKDGTGASGTWGININGTASHATLLAPAYSNSTFSTQSSTWRNGITDGYVVWGQSWVDTRLTSNSGDLTIWIKKVGSVTTANMTIDGTITAVSGFIGSLSGNAGGGHSSLGTSSWYFSSAYIDTINAYNIKAIGHVSIGGVFNTTYEYQSNKGSCDWRFGSGTGTGDQNCFGFFDYTNGFHGGWYGPTHSFRANGEIISTSANAFRAVYGNYGFIIRNDGANTYFMMTNSGDPYGSWNDNYTYFTPDGEWVFKISVWDVGVPTTRGYPVLSATTNERVTSLGNASSYVKVRANGVTYHCTYSNSDIRLKTNVKDSEVNALSTINRIKIRQFDWKKDGKHQKIGFIADELEEIDKKFSIGGGYEDKEGKAMDVKSVDTFYLMGYMVKAIQELSEQNLTLKQENDKILKEIELLKSKGESN